MIRFKIIRQIPGPFQYEFNRLELDGEEGDSIAEAEKAADGWADEQRKKLTPNARFKLSVDQGRPSNSGYAAGPAAAAPPARRTGGNPQPMSATTAPLDNNLHYPPHAYRDLIDRIMEKCGLGAGKYDREELEKNLVRVASLYKKKDGTPGYTRQNSLEGMARDYMEQGWKMVGITMTWENILKLEKDLDTHGTLHLRVPLWDKSTQAVRFKDVTYNLVFDMSKDTADPDTGTGQEAAEAGQADAEPDPFDGTDVPF